MKKVALILVGLLAIMLAGCGEGSSSAGAGASDVIPVVVEPTVDEASAEVTTPRTPYNLSVAVGTPPGLPN